MSYETEDCAQKNYKHAIFEIGYIDTNKDGKLNTKDDHDLYISDLASTPNASAASLSFVSFLNSPRYSWTILFNVYEYLFYN